MNMNSRRLLLLLCFLALPVFAQSTTGPYTQQQDLLYGEYHGIGLLMDVFTPTGDKNGLAIVDIASGAWHSDRGKIRDHDMAGMYRSHCALGFTVFAIRPGSVSRFTAEDMLQHIYTGIRWVKAHAADYGVNPDKLGLTGASAGAHLASMTILTPQPAKPDAKNPLEKFDTRVAAVGIFFPPTDFLVWGDGKPDFNRIGPLLFPGGVACRSEEEIQAKAKELSPNHRINGELPPILLWHGDADPVVPLQQSQSFADNLEAHGANIEFNIKPGGAHPWMTINEEVAQMAEWFAAKLK